MEQNFNLKGHVISGTSDDDDNIRQEYMLQRQFNKGSFGQIWLAKDLGTGEKVAVKVEPLSQRKQWDLLRREYSIYRRYLKDVPGFPAARLYTRDSRAKYLVLDLLGDNLQQLLRESGGQFSLKTTLMLIEQILTLVESLHEMSGCVSRDIKPDNLLMSRKRDEKILHLIDLGLAKRFLDPYTNNHVMERNPKRGHLTGTARYASLNAHKGNDQSRRDDLESAGYVFVYLLKGELPWQGIKETQKVKKYRKIYEIKQRTSVENLCRGIPCEFAIYLQYVRLLQYDEMPAYSFLRNLFRDVMYRTGDNYSGNFDWDE